MGRKMSKTLVVEAISKAAAGVDYSPRFGARCPWCGTKTKIYSTQPWEAGTRLRYHRCQRAGCLLAEGRTTIKSIEVDIVGGAV